MLVFGGVFQNKSFELWELNDCAYQLVKDSEKSTVAVDGA